MNKGLSQSLGNLQNWKKENGGLSGETSNGKFRIIAYTENIVRISVTRADDFDDFSYSVNATPESVALEITDSDDSLEIGLRSFVMSVAKKPVRFRFATPQGQPINEDDPFFGTGWNGEQVTTYKKLQEGERFIGLGEKTGPLDRRGAGYTNWNTDNFGYGTGADPLYSSVPFYIGIHHKLVYGIFLDNTHKTFFNFGASNNRFSSFAADAGEMNYYFIHGKSVAEVIHGYTHLTGRMEIPPLWSIGYQQCRYSYYPDKEVLNVASTFREKDIPADALVLDIHYMDKYKIFTWSRKDFPDPAGMLSRLKEMGFRVVVMCDPGIKVEEGYHTYDDGVRHDVFLKYPDGTFYTGQVWPGWCHFPDFTNPKTRAWWKDQFRAYVNLGLKGFWNDMNEIATWGNMLPENIELNFEGQRTSMRRGRNIYGFQMARSTFEATKELMDNERPFNLTRSGFAGIQRYAAVWTGDNVAYDEHMMLGVRIVNSMGLSGIAFAGYDVGGFVGNADSKLFARWISIGAFSPFFRGHSMINSRDGEPWSYGEEVEQISRNYIRFRYQLLPYIYALFFEASVNGMPLQRSLAIDHTHDGRIYEHQFHHQYLFGPSLLVAPVESNREFVKVYFPQGDGWYSLYNGKKYESGTEAIVECPLHRLPVFVKAGAILPMQHARQNTADKSDTLIVHVYKGKSDSSFTFYEDDGLSYNYQKTDYALRRIDYSPTRRAITFQRSDGHYQSAIKRLRLVFHAFEASVTAIKCNGQSKTVIPDVNRFFAGLEKFDPIHDPEPAPEENVLITDLDYIPGEMIIQW